ncbi:sulfatase [Candidatus Poribacteria bacterium]
MKAIDRRTFLKQASAVGASLMLSNASRLYGGISVSKRPNILFAIADDASHMSAYGDKWLNTPHFDRVAEEGVLFTNFFVTNPKCAPSRACTLTGRHTWELKEACNHWCVFPGDLTVYTDLLGADGYHVGHTGKGWAPGDWRREGRQNNPAGKDYHGRTLKPPAKHISNKDYAANFCDFLDARPENTPFCFWYGGHEPHRAYEKGVGVRHGKQTADVNVPAYWPDEELVRSDMLDYAFEIEWFDEHLGRMLRTLEEMGELDNTLVVVTSDNGAPFPRVKGQMYEDDCHLPLAVRWPEACPGGRVVDDLVSCVDFAPTFLEVAGAAIPADMTGSSFLNILESDKSGWIEPTRDAVFLGRECHDLGREGDRGYPVRCIRTREFFYSRNFTPDRWPAGNPETGFTGMDSSPTKDRILELHDQGVDKWFDLSMGKRPAEELYRITDDSECMQNLAAEPAYAEIKEQLWARLKKMLEDTGDPRIFGNGDIFDTYEYVGWEKASHSWKAYVEGRWQKQRY